MKERKRKGRDELKRKRERKIQVRAEESERWKEITEIKAIERERD